MVNAERVRTYAWPLVLAAGAILLYGRFNGWGVSDRQAANIAFVLSFFFFALLLPTVYYFTRILTRRPKVAFWITCAVFAVYALPYGWLGLAAFRHVDSVVRWNDPSIPASFNHIVWFPRAFKTFAFARDFAILAVAFAAIAASVWAVVRHRPPTIVKRAVTCLALLGALFAETVLHTGFRSPYTYLAHFQPWQGPNFWYHTFLLPARGMGAVEEDWVWFGMLDNLFKGITFEQTSNIFTRPFIHFVAAPFTYFVDSYDVFLILNPLLWFVAVLCTYDVVRRVTGSPETARFAAALTACGNGFIYYVAQPMSYLAYYVSVVVVIFAYERIMVREPDEVQSGSSTGKTLLFGAVLGLLTLTYDFLPMYPMLLLYAAFRREPVRRVAVSCVVGLAIYGGYFFTYVDLLRLPNNVVTSAMSQSALKNILLMLEHFSPGAFYVQTVGMLTNYVQNLAFGFVVLALLLAIVGFGRAQTAQARTFAAIALVPSVLLNVFLYYGGLVDYADILLISLPRFTYIAWLGVYTAAALALVWIAGPQRPRAIRPALAWGLVAAIAILQNVDSFGIPALTYHFMWPTPSAYADRP